MTEDELAAREADLARKELELRERELAAREAQLKRDQFSGGAAVKLVLPRGRSITPDGRFNAPVEASADAEAIRAAIEEHVSAFRYCYEAALEAHPALAGRVTVRFQIGLDGRVGEATAEGLEEAEDVAPCMARTMRRIVFAPRAMPRRVTYPFVFDTSAPVR